jgi:hypothetical protein
MVSGTIHLTGGRLLIYSGDRFQSNESSLAVNLVAGGSLILCPHSQLQILAANQSSGVMLAFQEGGTQQPFQLRANDVVMTPDWRIQMTGSMPAGEFGTLQLSTNRRGELCLASNAKTGQFFRISELAGDSTFDITGQSNIKVAGDRIENAPAGCSCQGAIPGAGPASIHQPGITSVSGAAAATAGASSALLAAAAPPARPALSAPLGAPQAGTDPAPPRKQKQRPQDVAGYVRSFIHLLFGR